MTQAREQSISSLSDAELIDAVRHGSTEAFGTLYQRHRTAARRAATYLAKSDAEREEVVSEAFVRIFKVLKAGKGPTEEFRPYLLRTMRNIAINSTRQQSPLALVADMEVFDTPIGEDPVTAEFHREMITRAFTSLPERWRVVLWHTEVEGDSPAAVAPLLGMSPNGVAALAYRAREGLSRAYLQMHLPAEERLDCRASRAKLGGYVRKSLTSAEMQKVSDHLDSCERCRAFAAGLMEINNDLRALIAPLVLGIPLATAYLGTSTLATPTLVSAPAKTASVGGQAIIKVALVIVAAAAVGGAARPVETAQTHAAAPAVPQMDALRQPAEQPPLPAPTTTPTPPAPPARPNPPTGPTSTPPAPPTSRAPVQPPAAPPKPTETGPVPRSNPPTPPSPLVTTPQTGHDCRPWHARPGCSWGRPADAGPQGGSPPGRRHGHR